MATTLYSCDDHLDLSAVPPTVWESRLPHALVEQGPRVVTGDRGAMWVCEGRTIGRSGLPPHADSVRMFSAIGRAGIVDDGSRAGRPDLRLADMDRDGLAASVIYGPLSLGFTVGDPKLQEACFAAWNDWAVEEFNATAPDRLCVLAFLPGHSPEAAALELERCAAARASRSDHQRVRCGSRRSRWDRLWSAAEETGLPVSFHIKGGTSSGLSYRVGKWQSAAYASVLPLQLDELLAIMVFGGALERHPRLTLVLAESGVGWLPYFLARMDLEWEALRDKLDYAPSVPPSELFRRQVFATFEEEPLAAQLIPMLGADVCMWASDYPHTDSTFPESHDAIERTLGSLPDADLHKIVASNCARLYAFAEPA